MGDSLSHLDDLLPKSKAYSLCNVITLGRKIKWPKTCEKRFYKHLKVVLSKKRLEKTANIRKMRAFLKWPKKVTVQRLKPMQNAPFRSKNKIAWNMQKTFPQTPKSCSMQKNGLEKQLIFEKWEPFENGQKRSQCKGYSPCKIINLGQKMKLPKTCEKRFYKHV